MDPRQFDSLTRSLAAPKTRRGFLGALAALGAGLLGARAAGAQVTQAQCGNKVCAANPGVCTERLRLLRLRQRQQPLHAAGDLHRHRHVADHHHDGRSDHDHRRANHDDDRPDDHDGGADHHRRPTPPLRQARPRRPPPRRLPVRARARRGRNPAWGGFLQPDLQLSCIRTTTGATVCGFTPSAVAALCSTDLDCSSVHGAGAVCGTCPGGTFCMLPCPIGRRRRRLRTMGSVRAHPRTGR